MSKKTCFMFLLAMLFIVPNLAVAAETTYKVYSKSGSIYSTLTKTSAGYMQGYSSNTVKTHYIKKYDKDFNTMTSEYEQVAANYGWNNFAGIEFLLNSGYEIWMYNGAGTEVGYMKFSSWEVEEDNSPPPSQDNTCTISNPCAVFQCPKWDEYMGKVDQIISKIPAAPNWDVVAEKFADEIAPRVKSDMKNLFETTVAPRLKSDMTDVLNSTLGSAPALPTAPDMPTLMEDIELDPPTGQEAEGLGDSTFSSDDIKDEAETIEEREDPTGGFKIDNPLDSIEDPPVLIPKEETVNMPKPKEEESAPPTPTEPQNAAPMPKEEAATAPTPKEEGATAPIPSNQENTAPVPKDNNMSAPVPSESGGGVPIPSGGEMSVPIPSG